MSDREYINRTEGLARIAGNEMLYKNLLGKFAASISIEEFKARIGEQDYVAAGEIVHLAKGVAGNLSLTAFYESSAVLMDHLRDEELLTREDVDLFISLYDETASAINAYIGSN